MKAPLLTALALASGNTVTWLLGLRVVGAIDWLPDWYRLHHWGDTTVIVLATFSLYLMSRAPLKAYAVHCLSLFLLWEIPTVLYGVERLAGPPMPDAVHAQLAPFIAGSLILLTAASTVAAATYVAPRRKTRRKR
ncbi:hypothetical protein [Paraburkholderia tropica]|uniref:hypothetical protein n=1 Tax=Paraburkholderia tropica TaxID=92647 RepID=UPI0016037D43|nr:hypothetical protein [Paraburkholderia tropica]QNB16233.1 hypothetical protein G5S35_31845 [Paraburkholderia tropica]